MNSAVVMPLFYSSVILNGTETVDKVTLPADAFYSSVILNGTETMAVVKRAA